MKKARRPAARRTAAAEREFLARYDASQFPHPSVAVDVALLTVAEGRLQALLIQRDEHPCRGRWSLPGGFVRMQESLDEAAGRVLAQKANTEGIFLEQLYTFGDPQRDPRTRVITVAYYALVDASTLLRHAGSGSEKQDTAGLRSAGQDVEQAAGAQTRQLANLHVTWKGERGGPVEARDAAGNVLPLAFDHAEILGLVVKRLRGKLDYAPIGFELLPKRFTLRQLQTVHETISGRRLNKDSFRRRMLATGLVAPTGKRELGVGHRPAELYRFKRKSSSAG